MPLCIGDGLYRLQCRIIIPPLPPQKVLLTKYSITFKSERVYCPDLLRHFPASYKIDPYFEKVKFQTCASYFLRS